MSSDWPDHVAQAEEELRVAEHMLNTAQSQHDWRMVAMLLQIAQTHVQLAIAKKPR